MTHATWQREIMEKGELFLVGGAVRDELMGVPNVDEDVDYLVRALPPDDLERILSRHGRVFLVGKSFGVFKFKPPGATKEIDIAYPRREVSTGTGHRDFAVNWDWTLPVEEDLGRRDFTINAIAQNLEDGRVIDPCGGRSDIEDRVLRMVFADAFREDPLRILRGVRFAARFTLRIEDGTGAAMAAAVPLVDMLSADRIHDEFNKLFTQCDRPSEGLSTMQTLGVIRRIFPELERCVGVTQNEFHPDDVFWHSLKSCDAAPRDNLVVRWAALLHDLGKVDKKQVVAGEGGQSKVVFYGHEGVSAEIAAAVLRRLRYGNDFIRRCVHLVESHMFLYQKEWNRGTVRRFIRRVGLGNLDNLFLLREADCQSRGMTDEIEVLGELRERIDREVREESAFKIGDLAIDGGDVMEALGIVGGPEIGRILRHVLERVLDDPELNTREELLSLVRELRTDKDE